MHASHGAAVLDVSTAGVVCHTLRTMHLDTNKLLEYFIKILHIPHIKCNIGIVYYYCILLLLVRPFQESTRYHKWTGKAFCDNYVTLGYIKLDATKENSCILHYQPATGGEMYTTDGDTSTEKDTYTT